MAEPTDSTGAVQRDAFSDTGELLRRAREAKGLSIQQVAQSLHLDAWILEALEDNRFKDIGAPVFVKGHLRKFAAEVGVSPEAVMEAYYSAEDTPETPVLVTDTLTRPAGDSRGRGPIVALSILLIALIVVVVWFWLRGQEFLEPWTDRSDKEMQAVSSEQVISATDVPAGIDDAAGVTLPPAMPAAAESTEGGDTSAVNANEPAAGIGDSPPADSATVAVAMPEAPAQADNEPPPEGMIRLSIAFANDSWVEIYDSNNRRLYFDLGKAGTRRAVSGSPPLQVLLGNAEGAQLTLNGAAFEIPAGARRGKTARFSVQ